MQGHVFIRSSLEHVVGSCRSSLKLMCVIFCSELLFSHLLLGVIFSLISYFKIELCV